MPIRLPHRPVCPIQTALFAALAGLCLVVTGVLATQVFLRLDEYGAAARGNIPWRVSRLEVDQLKLIGAIRDLDSPTTADLQDLRRRFGTFYSAAETVRHGASTGAVLDGPDGARWMTQLTDTMDRAAEIVDSGNEAILARREDLLRLVRDASAPIHHLASISIAADARRAETERTALTSKLTQMTGLSLMLLVGLVGLALVLWRLYQLYRGRALLNRRMLNRVTTILDSSQDAVLVMSRDGDVIETNPAAQSLFGLPGDGTDRHDVTQLLKFTSANGAPEPMERAWLWAACAHGPVIHDGLKARTLTGRIFPVEISASRARDLSEDIVVCFIRDISHRVATEARLRTALDRAVSGERAKARFLGMISHEMRTPLNGLMGALDLLSDSGLTSEQARYARIIHSSGQAMLNQITDALDVTQAESGALALEPEVFDLDRLLDDLVQEQSPQAEMRGNRLIRLEGTTPLAAVLGDPHRLRQVLVNLVSNAIKFTQDGEIQIEAARTGPPNAPRDEVEFQISDTGIGIEESEKARIFDDFVRLGATAAGSQGTGLGLGITQRLVKLMQGRMDLESTPGEGSLFWVRIPLPRSGDAKASTTAALPTIEASPPKDVLIVEDNATSRTVLAEMLEQDGHRVCQAENGEAALRAAACRAFHLILMDISMPGLDGLETARRIRDGGGPSAGARIVALTAHYRPEEADDLHDAGIDAVQGKPLRRAALRRLMDDPPMPTNLPRPAGLMDETILSQLRAALPEEALKAVIDGFLDEGGQLLGEPHSLRNASRQDRIRRLHRFSGLAATVGASGLQAALNRAETELKNGDSEVADAALRDLPGLWAATCSELQARHEAP